MKAKDYLIIGLLVTNSIVIVAGTYYYNAWWDYEYPHGDTHVNLKTIEYHSDKYSFYDEYYVSFNGGYWYILGSDSKNKIEDELSHWNNIFNTTNFIEENNETTYQFRIYYHTIDVPYECSSGSYKKKVIDDFELAGWLN